MSTIKSNVVLLIFLTLSSVQALLGGLEQGTTVLTSQGLTPIELLQKNDTVCSLNCTTNELVDVSVQEIQAILHDCYFAITLKAKNESDVDELTEIIYASPKQLFYEATSDSFRTSDSLTVGHVLYKLAYKKLVQVECIAIQKFHEKKIFYSLYLEKPHLFFSSKFLVLTHNDPISATTASVLLLEKGVEALPVCPQLGAVIIGVGITILFGNKIIRPFKNIFKKNKRNSLLPQILPPSNTIQALAENSSIELLKLEDIFVRRDDNNNGNREIDSQLHKDEEILEGEGKVPPPDHHEDNYKDDKRIKIFEKNSKHIFRKDNGHFEYDTPENRKLLEDVANNQKNFIEMKPSGTKIYRQLISDGREVWVEVFKDSIRNGGINLNPRSFL